MYIYLGFINAGHFYSALYGLTKLPNSYFRHKETEELKSYVTYPRLYK